MTVAQNSSIIIEGNTFDVGNDSPTGRIGYDQIIQLNLDANAAADLADSNGPGYAVVNGNYLSGINSGGTHLVVNSGSVNVTNNTFIGPGSTQDATPISAYINVSGSQMDHIITNNFFDSPAVDLANTNEQLVIGPNPGGALTPNTTYTNNKNQTGYMPISKVPNLVNFTHRDIHVAAPDTTSAATLFNTLPNIGGSSTFKYFDGLYNYTSDSSFSNPGGWFTSTYGYFTASETTLEFTNNFQPPYYPGAEGTSINSDGGSLTHVRVEYASAIDVNQYLPTGVQILSFTVGLAADGYVQNLFSNPPLGSNYSLSSSVKLPVNPTSKSYIDATTATTALSHGMADVRYALPLPGGTTPNSPIIASDGYAILTVLDVLPGTPMPNYSYTTSALLNSATQYLFLDVSGLSYTTGTGNSISVVYQAQTLFGPSNPTTQTFVYESPLIVRYRW